MEPQEWEEWVTARATPCAASTPQLYRALYRCTRLHDGIVYRALVHGTITWLTQHALVPAPERDGSASTGEIVSQLPSTR